MGGSFVIQVTEMEAWSKTMTISMERRWFENLEIILTVQCECLLREKEKLRKNVQFSSTDNRSTVGFFVVIH